MRLRALRSQASGQTAKEQGAATKKPSSPCTKIRVTEGGLGMGYRDLLSRI